MEVLASSKSKFASLSLRLVVNNQLERQQEEVVYEITKDPFLLNQYYKLREDCYRQDFGLKRFSGAEDDYDRVGKIVVARIGRRVIGGSRIIISSPEKRIKLPMENDNFKLIDILPEFSLATKSYCEFSRLVVKPGYRKHSIAIAISNYLVEIAKQEDCAFEFIISSMATYRTHRAIARKLGINQTVLLGITVPKCAIYEKLNEIGIYLSVACFKHPDKLLIPERLLNKVDSFLENMVA